MGMMKVAKWGNSLAVRLPAELVRGLGLKEGDYLEPDLLALYEAKARLTRERALAVLMQADTPLPKDYKFDREEANARG